MNLKTEIKNAQDRAEFERDLLKPFFNKLNISLGVVEPGSTSNMKIHQTSDFPILFFTSTCGCMSDLLVANEGASLVGNIEVDKANRQEEQVWSDGTNYYVQSSRGNKVFWTNLATGETKEMAKPKQDNLQGLMLGKYEHSLSLWFHAPTPMYEVTTNRYMKKNGFKPGIHIPVSAYVLPAAGPVK